MCLEPLYLQYFLSICSPFEQLFSGYPLYIIIMINYYNTSENYIRWLMCQYFMCYDFMLFIVEFYTVL